MKWINLKKNYPGNNKPIPGLERCFYIQGQDYQLPDDVANKLVKTQYAIYTTAPWERGTNRPMLEVNTRKAEIEKLQAELVRFESGLQNAREIALTIPIHEKRVEAVKKQLVKKLKSLEDFAKKNNIFLTKEAAEKAKADAAAKAAAKLEADKKAAEKAAKLEAEKQAAEQNQEPENENENETGEQPAAEGDESKDDDNAAGQAADAGQNEPI